MMASEFISFRSWFGKRLSERWVYSSDHPIWHIEVDEDSVVIETRNGERRSTRYTCLQLDDGKIRWQDVSGPDEWWCGIETVRAGQLLLHGFAKPDFPEHRGIYAYDVATGKLRWSQSEQTYWFHNSEFIFSIRSGFEKRTASEIDPETGTIIREFAENFHEAQSLRETALRETANRGLVFPEPFAQGVVTQEIREAIARATRFGHEEGSGEFAIIGHYVPYAYYVQKKSVRSNETRFLHRLIVLDANLGKVVFNDLITADAHAVVGDCFFVFRSRLFYIRNQHQLVCVDLRKS
ncbi:MAG: DUF4905 domain-containing protein [Ignavibacteriales bacterium]|nr:DUF4905 domain-containing protein [Ignavibacteriales bacterium]